MKRSQTQISHRKRGSQASWINLKHTAGVMDESGVGSELDQALRVGCSDVRWFWSDLHCLCSACTCRLRWFSLRRKEWDWVRLCYGHHVNANANIRHKTHKTTSTKMWNYHTIFRKNDADCLLILHFLWSISAYFILLRLTLTSHHYLFFIFILIELISGNSKKLFSSKNHHWFFYPTAANSRQHSAEKQRDVSLLVETKTEPEGELILYLDGCWCRAWRMWKLQTLMSL